MASGVYMPIAAQAQTTPSTTVEIGELGPQVRVSLKVGDTLRIVLPSTPSTGYSWRPGGNDTPAAIQLKTSTFKSGQQRPGAAGSQTITLTANSPGEDHLVLSYARPWEKGTKPARTYSVNIVVSSAGASPDLPVVTPAGTLLGTYSGKSRCADCSGILTTLAFYATAPQQMTDTYYVRTTKYLGSPKGDTAFVSAGNWSLKTGTAVDPKAVVYSLHSNTSDHVDDYQLKDDSLLVIGSDGKPAQNPYNTNLQKQP
ncbi:MAG TPA: protease inhibitor I42 family protein [Acidobacteriaceae bacterium]